MWQEIKEILHKADSFVITTHVHPDGDGVGSAVALLELLQTQGKEALFVTESQLPEKFHFLDFRGRFRAFTRAEDYADYEVVVVLDTQKKARTGRVAALLDRPGGVSLCIDHHVGVADFTPFAVIDPQACSVGAMIYTLYKESGLDLNSFAAQGIYTSVISDTGRFSYASTSRKAHKIADECLKVGVDPSQMHARLFQQIPYLQIEIFRRALSRMEFHYSRRVVLQQIRLADYADFFSGDDLSPLQDFDMIHDFNKSIQGIDVAAILWELPQGGVRISLRSNVGLDIVGPMKTIGGGGHPNAAGALLDATFDEAKKRLLELLRRCLFSSDRHNEEKQIIG